jgi:hypothetical protein
MAAGEGRAPQGLRELKKLAEATFFRAWNEIPLHRRAQIMAEGFSIDPMLAAFDALLDGPLPAPPGTGAEPPKNELDLHLLAWAVSNCHTLALRRLRQFSPDAEWWQHVQRICEKAGARSQGVLRASVPREMTEGARDGRPPVATRGVGRANAVRDR